jgi:murein DD-endopeptidase MepM/ murein hydrolase activator NlpD
MERDMIMKPWPKQYSATAFWGAKQHPLSGKEWFHNGVDVPMPVDTPIIAGEGGKIVEKGYRTGQGITLKVQYSNGMYGVYHHLSRYGKFDVGDSVRASSVVAYSGKTGRTTGPHLHFELWYNGMSLDPLKNMVRSTK